jgi:DNA-binding PadR family transcriptional regulator
MKESEVIDRDLSVMECFILALIGKLGLTSLYAFRKEAGLEPGGIRSALRHLEERGFISHAQPGRRMRRALALTAAGRAQLEHSWTRYLRERTDAETVLRTAFLAWVMDGPGHAAAYLRSTGDIGKGKAQETANQAEHLERRQKDALSGYAWMRTLLEAHRRNAESAAFSSIGESLMRNGR